MTPSDQGKTSTASLPVKVRSKPRVLRSSGTEHPNQVFVNVYNNSGTIVVGDNNEVTVRTSASSTTGIYSISNDGLRSDLMSAGFTPGQNGVANSQSSDLSHYSSGQRSAIGAQITKMTSFYPVVKHENCFGWGRGKRKAFMEVKVDEREGRASKTNNPIRDFPPRVQMWMWEIAGVH